MITLQSYGLLYLAFLHAGSLAAISPSDSITRTKMYTAQHNLTYNSVFQSMTKSFLLIAL